MYINSVILKNNPKIRMSHWATETNFKHLTFHLLIRTFFLLCTRSAVGYSIDIVNNPH